MNRFILLLFFLLRKKFDDSLFKVFGADVGKSMPMIGSNPVSFVGWSLDRVSWEEESHRGPPFRKGERQASSWERGGSRGAHMSRGRCPAAGGIFWVRDLRKAAWGSDNRRALCYQWPAHVK